MITKNEAGSFSFQDHHLSRVEAVEIPWLVQKACLVRKITRSTLFCEFVPKKAEELIVLGIQSKLAIVVLHVICALEMMRLSKYKI